jgi:hypothetical protein
MITPAFGPHTSVRNCLRHKPARLRYRSGIVEFAKIPEVALSDFAVGDAMTLHHGLGMMHLAVLAARQNRLGVREVRRLIAMG